MKRLLIAAMLALGVLASTGPAVHAFGDGGPKNFGFGFGMGWSFTFSSTGRQKGGAGGCDNSPQGWSPNYQAPAMYGAFPSGGGYYPYGYPYGYPVAGGFPGASGYEGGHSTLGQPMPSTDKKKDK